MTTPREPMRDVSTREPICGRELLADREVATCPVHGEGVDFLFIDGTYVCAAVADRLLQPRENTDPGEWEDGLPPHAGERGA